MTSLPPIKNGMKPTLARKNSINRGNLNIKKIKIFGNRRSNMGKYGANILNSNMKIYP